VRRAIAAADKDTADLIRTIIASAVLDRKNEGAQAGRRPLEAEEFAWLTELQTPFHGLIRISSAPREHALAIISQ
jgi:hypothetical protein